MLRKLAVVDRPSPAVDRLRFADSLLGLLLINCRQLGVNCRQTKMSAIDRPRWLSTTEKSSVSIGSVIDRLSTALARCRQPSVVNRVLSLCMFLIIEFFEISSTLLPSFLQWMWGTQNINAWTVISYFENKTSFQQEATIRSFLKTRALWFVYAIGRFILHLFHSRLVIVFLVKVSFHPRSRFHGPLSGTPTNLSKFSKNNSTQTPSKQDYPKLPATRVCEEVTIETL